MDAGPYYKTQWGFSGGFWFLGPALLWMLDRCEYKEIISNYIILLFIGVILFYILSFVLRVKGTKYTEIGLSLFAISLELLIASIMYKLGINTAYCILGIGILIVKGISIVLNFNGEV